MIKSAIVSKLLSIASKFVVEVIVYYNVFKNLIIG
jgi:hypothetical protein